LESSAPAGLSTGSPEPQSQEQVYQTSEGPVVITTRGKLVFVTESFPLDIARKLATLILDAQGTGELHLAQAPKPATNEPVQDDEPLTGNLTRFFSDCGVMKAAVEAARQAGISGAKKAAGELF
jgi:hypothetical protein